MHRHPPDYILTLQDAIDFIQSLTTDYGLYPRQSQMVQESLDKIQKALAKKSINDQP